MAAGEAAQNDGGRPGQRAGVGRARYGREPYVRATVCSETGETVDAKAISWTPTDVQLKWVDAGGSTRTRWVPASAVRRISRDESAWRDPYDDYGFYYPDAAGTPPRPAAPPADPPDAAE
ncbi:hypothetical protein [Arthrobacter mangrovi]|uniref:Uncharacterized protein n=1 Tax=Arthrobacter mangrovi TaxID=2966350 RepID=A0ABQ5MXW8_9MICC|nr:hypothetical protein [Arthrobacter mangrovi]GLB68665.1 hypothetical protein AHIS1636_31070 [Arthrobacter mangrovi]